jgi:hypothetical protein
MHVKLYLSPSEATLLTQLANADRRSPEAVAEILLRFSLTQCQTVQSFRERLDSLPEQTPTQELTHERSVGKIDAIVDILKEAKRKQHPLSIDEIHDEMVRQFCCAENEVRQGGPICGKVNHSALECSGSSVKTQERATASWPMSFSGARSHINL